MNGQASPGARSGSRQAGAAHRGVATLARGADAHAWQGYRVRWTAGMEHLRARLWRQARLHLAWQLLPSVKAAGRLVSIPDGLAIPVPARVPGGELGVSK